MISASCKQCAIRNLKKPLKFAHLYKLANQSMRKAHVIEITKSCIAAFMKARNSLVVDVERGKKQKIVKMFFLKLLLKVLF